VSRDLGERERVVFEFAAGPGVELDSDVCRTIAVIYVRSDIANCQERIHARRSAGDHGSLLEGARSEHEGIVTRSIVKDEEIAAGDQRTVFPTIPDVNFIALACAARGIIAPLQQATAIRAIVFKRRIGFSSRCIFGNLGL
jgi:hypothetical protein